MHIFTFDCTVILVAATFVASCCFSVSASFVTKVFALRWDHRAFTSFNLGFGITKPRRTLTWAVQTGSHFLLPPLLQKRSLLHGKTGWWSQKRGKKYKASSFKIYFYVISEVVWAEQVAGTCITPINWQNSLVKGNHIWRASERTGSSAIVISFFYGCQIRVADV